MAEERDELAARMEDAREERLSGRLVVKGKLLGRKVVLAESGVGKVAAGATAALLLHAFGCRAIVVAGVAGGIDPDVGIGDIVIADRLIQHDYGHRTSEGLRHCRPGVAPLGPSRERIDFTLSPGLLATLRAALAGLLLPEMPGDLSGAGRQAITPRLRFGVIVSGDQFINCEATRDELHRVHGALAVEMEGAAVAQVAETVGVPCVVVRSVSDLAGADSHLDFPRFLRVAAPMAADIVGRVVTVL